MSAREWAVVVYAAVDSAVGEAVVVVVDNEWDRLSEEKLEGKERAIEAKG